MRQQQVIGTAMPPHHALLPQQRRRSSPFRASHPQLSASVSPAAQHSMPQYSTAQHSTAQHSTAQHATVQHSTAQHSTAQHSTHHHHNLRVGVLRQPPGSSHDVSGDDGVMACTTSCAGREEQGERCRHSAGSPERWSAAGAGRAGAAWPAGTPGNGAAHLRQAQVQPVSASLVAALRGRQERGGRQRWLKPALPEGRWHSHRR